MIRLIALDLDGTLLGPNNRVSQEDSDAVIAARDKGIHIVLSTARWYGVAQYTSRRLELTTPLICMSGAHVQEPNEGTELLHLKIPTEIAREIATLCDQNSYETYTTVDGVTYMRTPMAAQIDPARLPKDMKLEQTHIGHVTVPATGFVVFGEEAVNALLGRFGEKYADILAFPVGSGEQKDVAITGGPSDQGAALRLACAYLQVPRGAAMAAGGAGPDLDRYAVAARGAARGC